MTFWQWFEKHIDLRLLLTPFGVVNTIYRTKGVVGYCDYYIFGIRIARIQKTNPWD